MQQKLEGARGTESLQASPGSCRLSPDPALLWPGRADKAFACSGAPGSGQAPAVAPGRRSRLHGFRPRVQIRALPTPRGQAICICPDILSGLGCHCALARLVSPASLIPFLTEGERSAANTRSDPPSMWIKSPRQQIRRQVVSGWSRRHCNKASAWQSTPSPRLEGAGAIRDFPLPPAGYTGTPASFTAQHPLDEGKRGGVSSSAWHAEHKTVLCPAQMGFIAATSHRSLTCIHRACFSPKPDLNSSTNTYLLGAFPSMGV